MLRRQFIRCRLIYPRFGMDSTVGILRVALMHVHWPRIASIPQGTAEEQFDEIFIAGSISFVIPVGPHDIDHNQPGKFTVVAVHDPPKLSLPAAALAHFTVLLNTAGHAAILGLRSGPMGG